MTAVGGGFLGQGLHQAGLQGQEFLGVFDAQNGFGMVGRLVQGGFGSLHIEFDQLLDAFEGLVGQAEHGFDGSFLRGNNLINGQHNNLQE